MGEAELTIAPGSVVVIRDEEWLVTAVEATPDGRRLDVVGLTELVRDTEATFLEALEDGIQVLDPRTAELVPDDSPRYRRTRLWLEATLRKTPVPFGDPTLTVSHQMLIDPLQYQRRAVAQALSKDNLRPRILIADAVGLGKTLEIGMTIAELTRRGRAERVLVVTPRHVLEQMQHELWTRFALPLVRLDSEGLQRVRQHLPATRNPFTFYKRVIISIDTLKSPRYRAYLEKQRWDIVVIDESHNLTNVGTLNNELARVLAPNTEALLLASATPHNGKKESFAELLRLLDPTAVGPDGDYDVREVSRLFIRRHRHSPEVAAEVGAEWAKRPEPEIIHVEPSLAEDAIAEELSRVWLYPEGGNPPYSGQAAGLFPWTLAKAFLSSSAALHTTVTERMNRIRAQSTAQQRREYDALARLKDLAAAGMHADASATTNNKGKFVTLVNYLRRIGIASESNTRVVLFAERIPTLEMLHDNLPRGLDMKDEQFALLHGQLSDVEQQRIVDDFKKASSPVRVLITGDVASEGVNFHAQCHNLVHVDIPWSLIRIEQRNGRIDRYGQLKPPQIAALALIPSDQHFSGDVRVLQRLLEKEHQAHTTLGDAASLMGQYSIQREEEEIRQALVKGISLDDVVPDAGTADPDDPFAAFDELFAAVGEDAPPAPAISDGYALFETDLAFLQHALAEAYDDPTRPPADTGAARDGGVGWRVHSGQGLVELRPPKDLRARLDALPQSYVCERRVKERLLLAVSTEVANAQLQVARNTLAGSTWPEAHFLSPLHPVLDWAADKVLATAGRNQVPVVYGTVEHPLFLVLGTLMNRRGQVVSREYVTVMFPDGDPSLPLPTAQEDLSFLHATGLRDGGINPGPVEITEAHQALVPVAVDAAHTALDLTADEHAAQLAERIESWSGRAERWRDREQQLETERFGASLSKVRQLARRVSDEEAVAESLRPDQRLVRPLLLIVPPSGGAF
jgi:superfamily II DNA or RNA helicase